MVYNPWPKTQSNTVAGRSGRVADRAAQVSQQPQHPPRRGKIVDVRSGPDGTITPYVGGTITTPYVKVRWDDSPAGDKSEWIPLRTHPMMLAMVFSSRLKDLKGQYSVIVHYRGHSSSTGEAEIVADGKVDLDMYDPQLESIGLKIV